MSTPQRAAARGWPLGLRRRPRAGHHRDRVDGQGAEPVITDGPYLESKEYISGFWVIEAPDLDVALRLAAEAAAKACQGKVEVPFQSE